MTAPVAGPGARRPQFDLQQEIKQLILEEGLQPGSLLPTETDLMARWGVSRSSVREALKSLQARSIVSIEHGRGTFVGQPSLDSFVDTLVFHRHMASRQDGLATAADLVDVREILETELVQRVARTADDALLADLSAIVERMADAAAAGRRFEDDDRTFHQRLYAPLRNDLVLQLLAAFWDVLDAVGPLLPSQPADLPGDAELHRRIVQRLRDRDAAGAAAAMRDHFRGTHAWIDGSVPH
ncbi:FadR/GntR family transcriptional regulator [Nakamurella endophytica]|uniref:Transcriptional regulator n=1 Tax=Nakamurella endophytica TaxID=1748367 RepID=A0A917SVG9_9ACTN|nr:FCD domain-containing protein [Nakamurella endophytica]GGL99571.1 transcriptional regulator [Nakamurella endophytica]